jgi:hypothetical protein
MFRGSDDENTVIPITGHGHGHQEAQIGTLTGRWYFLTTANLFNRINFLLNFPNILLSNMFSVSESNVQPEWNWLR